MALAAIWLILSFVVLDVQNNYDSVANMELDVGYVQEVEKWKKDIYEGAEIEGESILIAESPPPNNLEGHWYEIRDGKYSVRRGSLVIFAHASGDIIKLRNAGSLLTAQPPGASAGIRLQKKEDEFLEELEDHQRYM